MQPWFTVYFFDIGNPCYDQLIPVKTRFLKTSITWLYRGLESTTNRVHVLFWSWPLTKCWSSIGSWAHVVLTCCKQSRNVRKAVNPSPGLIFIRIITFSFIQTLFLLLFCVYGDCKTQNRKPNNKHKTLPQGYKTQIKILPFPWLA